MSTFKCKMCGGALEIKNNETVIECTYCGTMQTLPKLDDDRKANLYDRANHFRRNNEFDKAMGIYEQILNEDQTDAETYWSLVLCRYGIEYVEDPTSHKRIPTVNRAQFTSILADEDYKSALRYADSYQRNLYEQEAKAIDEIQKGILAISQQEEPFDVFICYKETDAAGRRTPDSVLANDLYHQLTQEGFRVFFSRITLEDKLGQEYEPYIFAALNSAKAMVVLGTKPEYFNAVWVKNEWSRYLSLIKKGEKKTLIPAYKDMDPYDLPEEFSHLQAQDMSKLGFMQDLIRGIKKIVQMEVPQATVVKETVVTSGNTSIAPLLKRAFMFLEDGEWTSAEEYCEKVLDMNPECAEAYLGKLMAELRVRTKDSLKDCSEPFDDRKHYQKALRFGKEKLKDELTGYTKYIKDRNEQTRKDTILASAKTEMAQGNIQSFEVAIELLNSISGWKEADELVLICQQMIDEIHEEAEKERLERETARKDNVLSKAKFAMSVGGRVDDYETAIKLLTSISGWKDADEQIIICQQEIEKAKAKIESDRLEKEHQAERLRKKEERIAKRNKIIAAIIGLIAITIAIWVIEIKPVIKRNAAIERYGESFVTEFENLKVGDTYTLGSYEQDNNISNGQESIEWIVLETQKDKVLLMSKKALDCQPYNKSWERTTWANSSLQRWLNNDFLNTAFTDSEALMLSTRDPNLKGKLFLLSYGEFKDIFKNFENDTVLFNSDLIRCTSTPYAQTMGVISYEGYCNWWLRSSAYSGSGYWGHSESGDYAVYVDNNGFLNSKNVNTIVYGVRPAMWIKLNTN